MEITREFLDAQIAAATARLEQVQADANAYRGAIQAWRLAMAQLDAPAVIAAPPAGAPKWPQPAERSVTHDQCACL